MVLIDYARQDKANIDAYFKRVEIIEISTDWLVVAFAVGFLVGYLI